MKTDSYIIEMTTKDKNEIVLKRETATGWEEAKKIIDEMRSYKLEEIKIDLYKETGEESDGEPLFEHCGDFTKEPKTIIKLQTKKGMSNGFTLSIAAILLFPIMLFIELLRSE